MHISRYAALFVLLFASVLGVAQEQVVGRTFGRSPIFSKERTFAVRTAGDRHLLVGDRINDETIGGDIYFWFFDPVTGILTDSTALNQQGDQTYQASYPGPDGGFLVLYTSSSSSGMKFAYFGPDATLSWSVSLRNAENVNGIISVGFVTAEDLFVSLSPSSGPDRLIRMDSRGFISEVPFPFPSNGRMMSLQYLPNNTVLVGGDYSGSTFDTGEIFVANITVAGEIIWLEDLTLGEFNDTTFIYEYMSDAYRPEGDTIIAITGKAKVGFSGRRFITILDTLGQVLEEYSTMDSGMGFFRDETDWNNGEGLSTENLNGAHGSFTRLENYRPVGETLTLGLRIDYPTLYGNYYDAPRNQIISALTDTGPTRDRIGFLRFRSLENSEERLIQIGVKSTEGTDRGVKLFAQEDGGLAFLALTAAQDNFMQPEWFLMDSSYNITSRIEIGAPLSSNRTPEALQRNNGDIVLARRRNFQEDRLLITQFSSDGELRRNSILDMRDEEIPIQMVELSTDQLVVLDYLMITNSNPPRSKAFLYLLDENNEHMSSIVVGDYSVSGPTAITVNSDDQILLRTSDPALDSARFISINPITRRINWDYSAGSTSGADMVSISQFVVLNDGTVAALLVEEGEGQPTVISYLKLSAEGEETDREEIYRSANAEQLLEFNLNIREDGTALVTFNRLNEGAPLNERYTLFALNHDPTANERIYLNAFPDSGDWAMMNDVQELSNRNVAVLSTGFGSAGTADEDIFLLIFRGGELLNAIFDSQLPSDAINVSPNPTFGPVRVELSEASAGPFSVAVFDAFGRVVSRHQTPLGGTSLSINLGDQPNGTYLLLVMDGNKRGITRKVIVQK